MALLVWNHAFYDKRCEKNLALLWFCRGPGPTWINVAYKLWSTVMLKRCREVIEADGGPINYWTLHSLWCLLKVKHRVTCNKWCLKVQKHAWFSCYSCIEADTNHKSARFFHTICHEMHDFTPTMPSIDTYHSFFSVRKFISITIWMIKIGKILFEIYEKMLGGDLLFWLKALFNHLKNLGCMVLNGIMSLVRLKMKPWLPKASKSALMKI